MSSSGSYAFNPAAANLTLVAFGRIGIRRTEITQQHLDDAANEANLVQVKLSNLEPNLWKDELYQVTLTAGTPTYALPQRFIAIQAAYITTQYSGSSTSQDRIIWPISTFEYAAVPDKTQQGQPTSYWYNRQITPEISFWPCPDSSATYILNLRVCSQIQDAVLPSGVTLDLPYRWLDVFVADLAYRLSRIYAPDKEVMRKADADEAWKNAAFEDQERVPIFIGPGDGMSRYYR